MSTAQHTPGPFVQIKRPKRWGVPSPAQWRLLVLCVEKGGAAYRACVDLSTARACIGRGWIEMVNHEGLAKITAQGKAALIMGSVDGDAAEAAIAKATGSAS